VEELLDTKQAFYEKEIARLQKVQEDLVRTYAFPR